MLKNFFKRRKEEQNRRQYQLGYDSTAGSLLRGETTPLEMEYRADTSAAFGEGEASRHFDRGVLDATNKICSIGAVVDDRNYPV